MSRPNPTPTPGPDRPSRRRPPRRGQTSACSAPRLIGVAVEGSPSGRDATVLGSLLARAMGAELTLIAVHEEPLLPVDLPGAMNWTAIEEQARAILAETRDSLAPHARIMVQPDVLVWRALRHAVRHEHRDLLVVGSAQDAPRGRLELGRNASDLFGHLERPLVIGPSSSRQHAERRLERIGVGFDGTPESRTALDFAVSMAAGAGAALEVRRGRSMMEWRTSRWSRNSPPATGTGATAELEVEVGMPTDVLSELGDRVDMLVLGSGRSGPRGRVQPGATGRGTSRLVTCPVLVVPRPATVAS